MVSVVTYAKWVHEDDLQLGLGREADVAVRERRCRTWSTEGDRRNAVEGDVVIALHATGLAHDEERVRLGLGQGGEKGHWTCGRGDAVELQTYSRRRCPLDGDHAPAQFRADRHQGV